MQMTSDNESKQSKERSLTTSEVMNIMNDQIKNVRDEFIGAIKGINNGHERNSKNEHHIYGIQKSQVKSASQLRKPNEDCYYQTEPGYNKYIIDESSAANEYIISEPNMNNRNKYFTNKNIRRQSYNLPNYDYNKEDYSTNESTNKIQPFVKSQVMVNMHHDNINAQDTSSHKYSKVEDISAVSRHESTNLGHVPCKS